MFSYKTELVKQLDAVIHTYDELSVDSTTTTPCITYLELSNFADQEGDTLRYSTLAYRITVWGSIDDELEQYDAQLDDIMFALGFKRRAYNEIYGDTVMRHIFTYEAQALEIV